MEQILVKNKEIVWRNLEGEAVLLNPHTGKYFGMNETGCSFWEKIDGKSSLGAIIELLLDEYSVERSSMEKDILELAENLIKHEIISFTGGV